MDIENTLVMLENGIAQLRNPSLSGAQRAKVLEVMGALTRQAHEQVTINNQMKEIENA